MQSAMTSQVTSFQKKSKNQVPSIPGSKLSVQNAQLLVSSGVPSLDYVIGGGIAVGTIVLIEEDTHGSYSKVLLRYFLAEGVVCGHSLLVASQERSAEKLVAGLPGLASDDSTAGDAPLAAGKLSIAWRYEGLKTSQARQPSSTAFEHHFDLTTTLPPETLAAADVHCWPSGAPSLVAPDDDADLAGLLTTARAVASRGGFLVAEQRGPERRNVLRVAVDGLGSPLWDRRGNEDALRRDLAQFLYGLRGLMRSAYAVAMVTVPAHLFKQVSTAYRCRHLADTCLRLESFSGSSRATHPLFREMHGLLHVTKLSAVNCLPCPATSDLSNDLGFKLRRKKFLVEKLHLPPELRETMQREQDDVGCGSAGATNSPLDF